MRQVDFQRAQLQQRGADRATPALDGTQARQQFGWVVRLHEVIVGTGIEAADAVGDLIARGQYHHDGSTTNDLACR